MRLRMLALTLCCLAAPGLAHAHSDENGPHGGRVEDATPGPLHVETVVSGGTLRIYLSDEDGHAMPLAGISGTATVLVNKVKQMVPLVAAGDAMKGVGDFTPAPDMRVLVSLTVAGRKQRALFSPEKE